MKHLYTMDKSWKVFTSTLIPHINELKQHNQKKKIYKNILRIFFLQLLKANEAYISQKHNMQIIHKPVENIHDITLKEIGEKSLFFPKEIANYISYKTEFQSSFQFKIRKQKFSISFYSYAFHLQDGDHFKNIEGYFRKIYMWFHLIMLYKRNTIKCGNTINVYIFLTPFKKVLPISNAIILGPSHVNSGLTRNCNLNNSNITIYRCDEWFKVLCHETFHHFNLDFHDANILQVQNELSKLFNIRSNYLLYESYCEFWALLWNSMFTSFSYANNSFEKFHQKYFQIIEDEKLFSCFQLAKVMNHNTLHYSNLINNKNTKLYKEESNVFAYYVIKTILLDNDDSFLKLLNNNNKNLLRFETTQDNIVMFCKFIEKHYKDIQFRKKIEVFEKILDNIDHTKIPLSYKPLFTTLNMTLY